MKSQSNSQLIWDKEIRSRKGVDMREAYPGADSQSICWACKEPLDKEGAVLLANGEYTHRTCLAQSINEKSRPKKGTALSSSIADSQELEDILHQYIIFGQHESPFNCARCGAGTDDNSQNFCWCTDRDSSASASSPTWIDNVKYPRFVEAKGKAKTALLQLALSCKIDGNSIVQPDLSKIPDNYHWVYFLGQKFAIDTMEQNMRKSFK